MILGILIIIILASIAVSNRSILEEQKGQLIGGRPASCVDTDQGITPFYKGSTKSITGSGRETSYEDKCEQNAVNEYYCFGGQVQESQFECQNGCKEGACVLGEVK